MMGGFLLLAWTDQFQHLGSTALLIMAVLTMWVWPSILSPAFWVPK
jgi:hypothetical protein